MALRRIARFCSKKFADRRGDREKFRRFFLALLSNALAFARARGIVRWKSQSGIYLCIRVLSGRVVKFASGKSHTEVVSLALSRLS
jgi:hypothetical protein